MWMTFKGRHVRLVKEAAAGSHWPVHRGPDNVCLQVHISLVFIFTRELEGGWHVQEQEVPGECHSGSST